MSNKWQKIFKLNTTHSIIEGQRKGHVMPNKLPTLPCIGLLSNFKSHHCEMHDFLKFFERCFAFRNQLARKALPSFLDKDNDVILLHVVGINTQLSMKIQFMLRASKFKASQNVTEIMYNLWQCSQFFFLFILGALNK